MDPWPLSFPPSGAFMKTDRGREATWQRTNRLHLAGIQFVVYITASQRLGKQRHKSGHGMTTTTWKMEERSGLFAEERHKGLI